MIAKHRKILAPCLRASALALGVISGYYHRAFAGTCVGFGGVYTCSGAAAPGDTTRILSNSSVSVTTTPGFGINTAGGDAFNLSAIDVHGFINFTDSNASVISGNRHGILAGNMGTGNLTITANGSITGTTGTGINVENWGAHLTISAADVSGGTNGIFARNLGTGLTVSADDVSGGLNGIFAQNQRGALSITTSGAVTGTAGDGIHAENYGSATHLTISAANVLGRTYGIFAKNSGSGALAISSSGAVTGTTGFGIFAKNYGTGLTISAADVFGGVSGIRTINRGSGALSITASGPVTGSAGMGIVANNYGTDLGISAAGVSGWAGGIFAVNAGTGAMSISAGDTVSGRNLGIQAMNSGTDLTISAADVSCSNYLGILGSNFGSGALSISASGSVTGGLVGIYGGNSGTDLTVSAANVSGGLHGIDTINAGSGALAITASGNVTGATADGIRANNSGTNLTISSADVLGGVNGIFANNAGTGALAITSSGSVTGTTGDGIYAKNFGTGLTISAAEVFGGNFGIFANNFGSGALSISASGPVTGGMIGIEAINLGTGLSISAADVSGGYGGIFAYNSGSGALSITASGSVVGGMFGISAVNFGTDLTISAANVSGGISGIEALNLGSGALTITAGGTVTGTTGDGILAFNSGGGATTITVTPTGIVEGGLAGIEAISSFGQPVLIDVYGQVRNLSGQPTDTAITVSGGPATVNLHAPSLTTGVVNLGDAADTVNLAGAVNGSIRLNGGNDTLVQSGGSLLTGIADGGEGTDTLTFNNMGVALDGSRYHNFENLDFFGGSTTLTGTWDFTGGTTTLHQGNLYVNGTLLTANLTVDKDGLLGGSGHIFGDVTVYGTVSPGNSIGTLDVTGSVGFMPGSSFVAQLGADGSSDLLRVDGAVSIDGGHLAAFLPRGLYPAGQSWKIIDASGGISGRFSSLSTNFTSATIELAPVYGGDSLDLVIFRTPYATFGATVNQASVGGALDDLLPSAQGTMAAFLTGMDFDLDAAGISATLAGLNPEMYTAFPSAGLAVVKNFGGIVALRQEENQAAADFASETPEKMWNVWGRVFGSWLDRDGQNNITGYSVDSGGTVFGLDRAFFSMLRAGIELGYGNSDLSWEARGSDGHIDAKHLGFYADTRLGGFHLDGAAGYTSLDSSASRTIATPELTARAGAGFDANVWNTGLSAGYDFAFGPLRLGPLASFQYLYLDQGSAGENGAGDFAVSFRSASAESLTGSLGLRATAALHQFDWSILPRASLALAREFKEDPVRLTGSFAGYPEATFIVAGTDQPENKVLVRAGLSVEYGLNLSMFLDFSADLASHEDGTLLTGGLAWNF